MHKLPLRKVRIWDTPVRLFHWSLAALVAVSFVSIKVGGNYVQWHFYSGYAILTLMLWRILWGFFGSRYSRFAAFPPSIAGALDYLRGRTTGLGLGHSPLAAWSVYGLLAVLTGQAIGGLFANDDIASEGPMAKFISKALSDQITSLHHLNERVIISLVVLHIAAIFYYIIRKNNNLIGPMIAGDKELPIEAAQAQALSAPDDGRVALRAGILLALCAAVVATIVNWPAPAFAG
jgi:cytochrome b